MPTNPETDPETDPMRNAFNPRLRWQTVEVETDPEPAPFRASDADRDTAYWRTLATTAQSEIEALRREIDTLREQLRLHA